MNRCQSFLSAYRQQVHADDVATEKAASVSGEPQRYTVHAAGGFLDVNAHCKYCARVELLEHLAEKREAAQ